MAEIWTHQDVLDHVTDLFELTAGSRGDRLMRMAVRNTYRDIPNIANWTYLNRRGLIATSAPYSTGALAYDHTGGANERLVTLTTGTWPSWARYGTLVIDSQPYKVESRVSDSLLTLDSITNPGADVASGTSYSLYRSQYPLPNGFRKIGTVVDVVNNEELAYIQPDEVMPLLAWDPTPSTPNLWTIRGLSGDYVAQRAIEFSPPPSEARTYHYLFGKECRELLLVPEIDEGTVSTSSTTVTGTSTAFTSAMVGAVIRFSNNTTQKPTNLVGSNPYNHQTTITAFTSATSLTVETAPGSALSGVKYTISDPIDVDSGPMFTWFLRACEAELAMSLRIDKWEVRKAAADEAFRRAREADYPRLKAERMDPYRFAFADWTDLATQEIGTDG